MSTAKKWSVEIHIDEHESRTRAEARLLLTATTLGLSASFMSQPIEVRTVREELRRALGGVLVPQALLRMGFSTPVPATPRRPVAELLMEPTTSTS